jgi:transposase-like protein
MPKQYRKDTVSESLPKRKLCPHCGHDDFKVTPTKFSWLFGQKFVCAKCGGQFRQANLVRAPQKEKHITKMTSFRRRRQKKRR